MTSEKITSSQYYPEEKLIVTHISGDVDKTDIETWEQSLHDALAQVNSNDSFKIFINLYGFKAIDIDAHKRFRAIVPLTLAQYGWKVGYLDMFEEDAKSIQYTNTRGIKCVGAVHVHQDKSKIDVYESNYSRENEHFYTDPDQAEQWIRSLRVM